MRIRRAMHVVLTLLLGYVLLALLVMLVQRKLIYFPSRFSPEAAVRLASAEGFREWRNHSGELIGWHLPATAPATNVVLIIHGNAGCAFNRSYLAQPIHSARGVDVFVLEYPGYGCRGGKPSKRTILSAAEEAVAALPRRARLYIVSESLGAGAAVHLAARYATNVHGLALFAPYDKLSSVGQAQMPWLPVGVLLWDRFEPANSLKDYRGPVKIVLAGADTVIPPRLGRKLHDSYSGRKSLEVVPDAGHNDIAEQSPDWWRKVFAFWEENQPRK